MTVLERTRLRIRDQGELLNQIAGTYRDFFRAAMEYVDNAVDAASAQQRLGVRGGSVLRVEIDTVAKTVAFIDNCGGMAPRELAELLSEVGRSKKKTVAWANGQFGFGVHAFRAFAREAVFISRTRSSAEAVIKIDRRHDENRDVVVEETQRRLLDKPGTAVTISRFDPQVFKRATFSKSLVSEIEHHFDDVLRAGLVRILVQEDKSRAYECRAFDYEGLPGATLKRRIALEGSGGRIDVNLKILERAQENRLPILTNKQRRVQTIADLKSYKTFARNAGVSTFVWSNPFVVGAVEINDFCSPSLSRDDLRDSVERDALYGALVSVQKELQELVDRSMNRKVQDSFRKLADAMSDALSRILRGFRLQFDRPMPSALAGAEPRALTNADGDVPFGGDDYGGGGPGPGDAPSGAGNGQGRGGLGEAATGGGAGTRRKGTDGDGQSSLQLAPAAGPRIEFQAHSGEDRVIDLGNSLIINTQHPDFVIRNASRLGQIRLDARLLNYVAIVVAPLCVHRLFERRGKVPTPLEVGTNVVELSTKLEQELVGAVLGMEISRDAG